VGGLLPLENPRLHKGESLCSEKARVDCTRGVGGERGAGKTMALRVDSNSLKKSSDGGTFRRSTVRKRLGREARGNPTLGEKVPLQLGETILGGSRSS